MNQRSVLSTLFTNLPVSLAVLAGFPLAGCSSESTSSTPAASFSCSSKGPCAADPTPSSSQIAACEALEGDGTCGAAFKAYSTCAFSVARCTDAGMSDPEADSTSAACNSSYATYTTCLGNKIVDGGAD